MKCKNIHCNKSKVNNSDYCGKACYVLDKHPRVIKRDRRSTGLKVLGNKAVRGIRGRVLYIDDPLPEILTTVYPHL